MNRTYIIAEAGVNHNGDILIAKNLIDEAVKAGADAVKFQTFITNDLVTNKAGKAEYQIQGTGDEETQYEMIKKLELRFEDHYELLKHCKKMSIDFLSSPFDIKSIHFLNKLGLNTFKIPSGEITNLPYLKEIGKLKKKVIISTGMSRLDEIEEALKLIIEEGTSKDNITVLHCNTEYPTPYSDVNLNAMTTMARKFEIQVGLSDHTLGIEVPIAAVAIGAKIIEKHFTLDKNMYGPDHRASLEPNELNAMIKAIRNIELALGDGIKKPSSSELKNIHVARKSIVAAKKINIGDVFTEGNIKTKRPGIGLSPMLWDSVIGQRAIKDFNIDDLIEI